MHTNSRLSINFFTRKCRRESENLIIHARITHDKSRAEFSLNRELLATLWDNNRNQKVTVDSIKYYAKIEH